MAFTTKLVKCLGCGKEAYLYRTQPGAKRRWYLENPDGKRHHCPGTETAAQRAYRLSRNTKENFSPTTDISQTRS